PRSPNAGQSPIPGRALVDPEQRPIAHHRTHVAVAGGGTNTVRDAASVCRPWSVGMGRAATRQNRRAVPGAFHRNAAVPKEQNSMGIGVSLFLLAVGAILTFAI